MDTVIVSGSQFYSHFPRKIPKGSVDAEKVEIRLDSEWDGLTVRIHWLNVASNVERKPLLERDQPNTIPWEVLTDLGELRMGLVGLDGETVIKPTIWLTYGYVSDGVDPEAGDDPQPPTPSWEQQMVEQATQANQAAQDAKEYAQQVAESIESAGPYAEEAKKAAEAAKASETAAKGAADTATQQATKAQEAVTSIGNAVEQAQSAATAAGTAQSAAETAKGAAAQSAGTAQTAAATAGQAAQTAQGAATQAGQYLATVEADAKAAASAAAEAEKSQEAAQTAAQEAGNARDQAATAATTAQDHATAASTAKDAAEQSATTAATAKTGAEQAAQAAAGSASVAQAAQQAAEAAAAILPTPTPEAAGKGLRVNNDGTGYEFGNSGGELLLAEYIHQGNQEIYPTSIDWETGVIECADPHGLTEATQVIIVPNNWDVNGPRFASAAIPVEWSGYQGAIYLLPVAGSVTELKVVGTDKSTAIAVDAGDGANASINIEKLHFEIPIGWSIQSFPFNPLSIRVRIVGFVMSYRNRMLMYQSTSKAWEYIFIYSLPDFGVDKPKHMIFSCFDVGAEVFDYGATSTDYTIINAGRKKDRPELFADSGVEQNFSAPVSTMSKSRKGLCGFRNSSEYAVFSNRTIVRIYAKGCDK